MKKQFLFFIFTSLCFFSLFYSAKILAVLPYSIPSFELYNATCGAGKNCTPYPAVENVQVLRYGNYDYVTAHIFDKSGVRSAVANIEDPANPTKFLNKEYSQYGDGIMYDDGNHQDGTAGDGVFGARFDISDDTIWGKPDPYWIDIDATDIIGNNSMKLSENTDYVHIGTLNDADQTEIALTATPNPGIKGGVVTMKAVLKYKKGPVIPGQIINLYNDTISTTNVAVSGETDDLGIALIDYYVAYGSPDTINLRVRYEGSQDLQTAASFKSLSLNLNSCGTQVVSGGATLCINPGPIPNSNQITSFTANGATSATVTSNSTVSLSATLDGAGAGQTVTFFDRSLSNPMPTRTAVTNDSGVARVPDFLIPLGANLGESTIRAFYAGGTAQNPQLSYRELVLTIQLPGNCVTVSGATLCLNLSPISNSNQISSFTVNGSSSATVNAHTYVSLSATLAGNVSGETITFSDMSSSNPLPTRTAITNDSGVATVADFQIPFSANIGDTILKASYPGNTALNLQPSYKLVTLTVQSLGGCVTVSGATICTSPGTSATPSPTVVVPAP